MTAHNSDEGLLFTSPLINSSEATLQFATSAFPHISQESLKYLNGILYPKVFDGSQGYFTYFERAKAMVADASFICNVNQESQLTKSIGLFSVYPGYHDQDQNYIYYTNSTSASSDQTYTTLLGRQTLMNTVNTTIAFALQDYISSFVVDGKPERAGYPGIPIHGSESSLIDLSGTGIGVTPDSIIVERCQWWQEGLYY
ncbi:hypothetical protein BGZ60DRAFT_537877 [Tricladium varicosporioides]|nr:hypothetical protein BGZ60DRAFT_537877 [Hymenoscyphus varicosporioides]